MILRELLTILGFEVDTKELTKFERSVDSAKFSLLAIGGAITGAATALFGLVKNVGSVASEINDSSRELGLSTDALQEWRYAADQAGIANETLANSIGIFSRNVGSAATNATGPFVERLSQLGIKLTDTSGKLKDNDTLLLEVADSLMGVKDAQMKGIIAQDLFGKSGLRMVSWLSSGSHEVQALRDKAKELGLVLGGESLNAAGSFENTLKTVFSVVKAIKNEIGVALIPVVKEIAESFLLWIKVNREFLKQRIVEFFERVVKWAGILAGILDTLSDAFDWLAEQMGSTERAIYVLIGAFLLIKLGPLIYFLGVATVALWRFTAGLIAAESGALLIPVALALIATTLWLTAQEILEFFGIIEEADKLTAFETLKASIIGVVAALLIVRAISLVSWVFGLAKAATIATGAFWMMSGGLVGIATSAAAGALATWALVAPFAVLIGLCAVLVFGLFQIGKAIDENLGEFTFVFKFKAAWMYLKTWLGSFFSDMGKWLKNSFDKIIDGFLDKVLWLKDKIKELNPFGSDKEENTPDELRYDPLNPERKPDEFSKPLAFESEGRKPDEFSKPLAFESEGSKKTRIFGKEFSFGSSEDERNDKPRGLSFDSEGNKNTRLGTIKNFFQGIAGESQMLAAAPTVVPQQIMRSNNSNTSNTVTNNRPVNVTSNVNVNMPPSVSSVNEAEVTAAVRAAWQEDLQKMLETAHFNNAELE